MRTSGTHSPDYGLRARSVRMQTSLDRSDLFDECRNGGLDLISTPNPRSHRCCRDLVAPHDLAYEVAHHVVVLVLWGAQGQKSNGVRLVNGEPHFLYHPLVPSEEFLVAVLGHTSTLVPEPDRGSGLSGGTNTGLPGPDQPHPSTGGHARGLRVPDAQSLVGSWPRAARLRHVADGSDGYMTEAVAGILTIQPAFRAARHDAICLSTCETVIVTSSG